MGRALLGGLTPATFLKHHWQKAPLLVRGAFPGFRDPVSQDELAALAGRDDVESRLVMEKGGARPWLVADGPLDARGLGRLPPTHWTLLVQGVDRQVPGVAELLEHFRFIPSWRVDDVMVSFAAPHGSVGPHVDSYDVFLLQGRGRRRWRIATRFDGALRRGLDLRVLRRFRAAKEWILGPGDLLYLPPGVAHHGVALEPCLTYSIGFRAPSAAELVAGTLERLLRDAARDVFYRDPGLSPPRHPGEISPGAIAGLRRLLDQELGRLDGPAFARLVGGLLTEPKAPAAAPTRSRVGAAALRRRLAAGGALVRSPHARLAFVRRGEEADLFVDGCLYPLPRTLEFAAPLLADRRRLTPEDLAPHLRKPGFALLLARLVNDGAFAIARR